MIPGTSIGVGTKLNGGLGGMDWLVLGLCDFFFFKWLFPEFQFREGDLLGGDPSFGRPIVRVCERERDLKKKKW